MDSIPVSASMEAYQTDLDPEQDRRLDALLDRHSQGLLSDDEQAELKGLIVMHAQFLHEQSMRVYAGRRGISVEQAHHEVAAQLKEALAWWESSEAGPDQQRMLEEYAQRRKEIPVFG